MSTEEEFQYYEETADASDTSDASEISKELVAVAVCYDLAEAEKIKNFLELEGFQVVVTNHDGLEIDDLTAHIDNGVDIKVFSEDGTEATQRFELRFDKFLEEQLFVRTVGIDSGWGACPKCQSKNLEIITDTGFGKYIWTYITTFSVMRNLRCGECGFEWETARE
jgi:hypothetical protein